MARSIGTTELQRIARFTAKSLRSGESRSTYDDTSGFWSSAIGLNPFIVDSGTRFLSATQAAPTQIGNAQIADIPIAYAHDPVFGYIYILGTSGYFYLLITSGTVQVIVPQITLTTSLIPYPTGAMMPVTDVGGNNYLFICGKTTLVRWDLNTADSLTHWNTSNSLYNTNHHPMHKLFLNVYFGNLNYLGTIPLDKLHNQAGALNNVNFQLIQFESNQTVTALGDDSRYLIVAISSQLDDSNIFAADTKIIWYPNVGINWDWEVTLKGERAIRQIIRTPFGVFALGEKTIYQIAFGQQPKIERTFDSADTPGGIFSAISQNTGPRVDLAHQFGDSMIFGKRGAVFGKRYPTEPVTFSHPLQGHTSNISMIIPDFVPDKIYVGTEDSKLWTYDLTQAGNTANSYVSEWIDLGRRYTVSRIEVELPAGIAASDVIGVKVASPSGDSSTVSLSQATLTTKRRTNPQITLKPTVQTSQVQITVTHSAGAPKHGAIYLYGLPTAE